MSQGYLFNAQLSKLWDFILFPMHYKEDVHSTKSDSEDENPVPLDEGYTNACDQYKAQLAPFKLQIESFYFENNLNLLTLLKQCVSMVQYPDLFSYLDQLQLVPKVELVAAIHYTGLVRGDYADFQPDLWEKATALANHPEETFNFLNTLDYSHETKWHLLTITQDPHGALKRYGELMRQIQPFFEAAYAPFAPTLEADGKALVSKLNAIEDDPFNKLTDGMVSSSLFSTFPIYVNYSYLFAYSLAILISAPPPVYNSSSSHVVCWGANLESYFLQIKAYSTDRQNERILLFKNLGDKTRYQVAQCVANGIVSTKIIAEQLGVSAATISYHLNHLTASKILLLQSINGKFQYAINKPFVEKSLEAIRMELCEQHD